MQGMARTKQTARRLLDRLPKVDEEGQRRAAAERRPEDPAQRPYLAFFRLGVDPWRPRASGEAFLHDEIDRTAREEDDNDGAIAQPFVKAEHVWTPFHGDGFDRRGERGWGVRLLEMLDPWGHAFLAWDSWGEDGHCVPPLLADGWTSPRRYYRRDMQEVVFFAPLVLEGPDVKLRRWMEEQVAAKRASLAGETRAAGEPDSGFAPVSLATFPDECLLLDDPNLGGLQWVSMEEGLECLTRRGTPSEGKRALLDAALRRVRFRRQWLRQLTTALIRAAIGRHFGLPRDVTALLADYVRRPPHPE